MQKNTSSFSNRSVLITGCSSGIGRATALYLAQNGFTVFASVRKEADGEDLRQLQVPNMIPICPLDLSSLGDIPPIVETIHTELLRRGQAGLYALINNAGGGAVAPVELMDLEVFHKELQTRLVGSVALVQAFLPLLRQSGGRILWIVTPAAIPTPYVTSIHACDFAVNCLARTLDLELKPWHIPSIQIRCGGIKTARGLKTTAEVEAILQHPKGELYREALLKWSEEMAEFDRQRTEPEKVARLVRTALSTPKPKRRYPVGYMSGAAAFLEALPQALTDKILKMRF
ncbi:MAG: SDR family NAD(P)-dependent oxidoreductase [Anaerolineaceae bacterium]|jgi:NAD(P)-dependent dehydrogenase (short-subunit alcohol dehydrogenase family)